MPLKEELEACFTLDSYNNGNTTGTIVSKTITLNITQAVQQIIGWKESKCGDFQLDFNTTCYCSDFPYSCAYEDNSINMLKSAEQYKRRSVSGPSIGCGLGGLLPATYCLHAAGRSSYDYDTLVVKDFNTDIRLALTVDNNVTDSRVWDGRGQVVMGNSEISVSAISLGDIIKPDLINKMLVTNEWTVTKPKVITNYNDLGELDTQRFCYAREGDSSSEVTQFNKIIDSLHIDPINCYNRKLEITTKNVISHDKVFSNAPNIDQFTGFHWYEIFIEYLEWNVL
jgi:hypothetical protein